MQRIDICFNVPKKDQTLIGPELVKIYIIEDDIVIGLDAVDAISCKDVCEFNMIKRRIFEKSMCSHITQSRRPPAYINNKQWTKSLKLGEEV